MSAESQVRLLLVGAGHAHLHLLLHARSLLSTGYDVTLLSPASFHYSGTASATATGHLPVEAGRIDVAALARVRQVRHHEGFLTGIDLGERRAVSDNGTTLGYDVVSFNIGSVVAEPMPVDPSVLRVKPLSSLAELAHRLTPHAAHGAQVNVIGSGASGMELAAQLSLRPDVARVRLIDAGSRFAPGLPRSAARRLRALLARRGVEILTGYDVRQVGAHLVLGADGSTLPHDVAVLASGLRAASLVSELGLGDPRGIPVTATLQHPDHRDVYAAGDCAHFLPDPLPRVGVHGVRQGPVLHHSLLARASGRTLPTYSPPRRALSILDLGDDTGLAVRGRAWMLGHTALRLKRSIDHRWLRQYR